jgi:hypothetical protein
MAKSFRYDGDNFGHIAANFYECDECAREITSNGSYVEDMDGFRLFVCAFCARQLTQHVPTDSLTMEVFA